MLMYICKPKTDMPEQIAKLPDQGAQITPATGVELALIQPATPEAAGLQTTAVSVVGEVALSDTAPAGRFDILRTAFLNARDFVGAALDVARNPEVREGIDALRRTIGTVAVVSRDVRSAGKPRNGGSFKTSPLVEKVMAADPATVLNDTRTTARGFSAARRTFSDSFQARRASRTNAVR